MTDQNGIRDFVRSYRQTHALTRQDLADCTGCSVPTIERLERGRPVSTDTLQKIAAYLDTTVAALLAQDERVDDETSDDAALPLDRMLDGRALAETAMRCTGKVHLEIPKKTDPDIVKAMDTAYDGLHELAGTDPGERPSDRMAIYQQAEGIVSTLSKHGLVLAAIDVRVHGHEVLDDGGGMPVCFGEYWLTELVAVISDAQHPILKASIEHRLSSYEHIDDLRFRPSTTVETERDGEELPF